jgi:DNA-directed RNA polymerase subunit F
MEIISESPIDLTELKEEVAKIKKRDKELGLRTTKTEDYLNSFAQLTPQQEKELVEKLTKLNIPRVKDNHIRKIVDLLPATIEDLKVVLQGYTISVSNDNLKKIVEAVKAVAEKK